jgi:hypothetical protein
MQTEQHEPTTKTVFLQTVAVALAQLKQQLQCDYEQAYPELREVIHLVLDEEEFRARKLTIFPHLLLPDLVEAHVEKLNLRPAETKHADVFASHNCDEINQYQHAFAA